MALVGTKFPRRYKDGSSIPFEFYVPDVIMASPQKLMTESAKPLPTDFALDARMYIQALGLSAVAEYQTLIDLGVAPEQARMVLPQSMITEWIWTGSLYGWASMYKQRSTEHAQYEARLFAEEVAEVMKKLFPICWEQLTK